ncbi:transcriptional regulator [Aggregicoccus sp. 17bor-14]|uniref:cupin domain-containing protein n=1 Tax=Myxococcaceae TaxID=31 RepID=UPI00129C47FE|nr:MULTISPECIES: cupin domain-containing protein [Myxococcaceae]MBF5041593.1 cupin domain-containing protein [Simulacricoccus sp. 17bor-14]MRI87378.1 transcriptional regulator [Aggregicoccus sp. 17bor-14]
MSEPHPEHLEDLLPDLALGTLPAHAQARAEAHLARCAGCRAELARLRLAVGALAPAVAPPPPVLEGLLAEMQGPERLAYHAGRVAQLFDLDEARARALLRTLSDPAAWQPGPTPDVDVVPVETGPARAGMLAAFARMRAGSRYPRHTHHGREWTLVLEGGMREETGEETWPGETFEQADGTTHAFSILPDVDCLAAALFEGHTTFDEPVPGR